MSLCVYSLVVCSLCVFVCSCLVCLIRVNWSVYFGIGLVVYLIVSIVISS